MSLNKNILLKSLFSFFIFVPFFFFVNSSIYALTYYVDNDITEINVGSSVPDYTTYDHSTFAISGGTDSVYKTIADINASTFFAGDSIPF